MNINDKSTINNGYFIINILINFLKLERIGNSSPNVFIFFADLYLPWLATLE